MSRVFLSHGRHISILFLTLQLLLEYTTYSLDAVIDKRIGKIGTPERDQFEAEVEEAVHAYRIGEAIKQTRLQQNLTQEQLGERVGVKKAQISRVERGYSITIPTMSRIFRALGITSGTLDLGAAGRVALW